MSIYDVRKAIKAPQSNVREIMESKGVTIMKLVEVTQLPKRIIQNARCDEIKTCKLETLAIIAQGLGVKIKDLFDEG
jgi:DNA-binding Xre family transcriptional regulator